MPQIRTTINPEQVVEVDEKEFAYLRLADLVREVVNPDVPSEPQDAAPKKAATKESR